MGHLGSGDVWAVTLVVGLMFMAMVGWAIKKTGGDE